MPTESIALTPTFSIDLELFHHDIPIELRYIVHTYVITTINNNNIHSAVKLWMNDRNQGWIQYGHISHWDTSTVTEMNGLFTNLQDHDYQESLFNDNINDWDVSQVTNMAGMFYHCTSYNQPLYKWNTCNVVNMIVMFHTCISFNQPLNTWNTQFVQSMTCMFYKAYHFNQSLSNWNVSNVHSMGGMFARAHCFNQSLHTWQVNHVTRMGYMFQQTTSFNQPLEDWDISQVTSMQGMFSYAFAFNQSLNRWHINPNTVNVNAIFVHASSFSRSHIATWPIVNTMFDDPAAAHGGWLSSQVIYIHTWIEHHSAYCIIRIAGYSISSWDILNKIPVLFGLFAIYIALCKLLDEFLWKNVCLMIVLGCMIVVYLVLLQLYNYAVRMV